MAVKQLAEDFARYLYLPRLKDSMVLVNAILDGMSLLTWQQESFAFADSFDEDAGRYRGLRGGQNISVFDSNSSSLLVKGNVALAQINAASVQPTSAAAPNESPSPSKPTAPEDVVPHGLAKPISQLPKRFHGTVDLDSTRVGRDAGRVAEEVIAHLTGLIGAKVKVTLEIEAEIPAGASDHVVRTVTENSRTLKFTSQGFEKE